MAVLTHKTVTERRSDRHGMLPRWNAPCIAAPPSVEHNSPARRPQCKSAHVRAKLTPFDCLPYGSRQDARRTSRCLRLRTADTLECLLLGDVAVGLAHRLRAVSWSIVHAAFAAAALVVALGSEPTR